MQFGLKLALFLVGTALMSVSSVYTTHPTAPVMAYVAAVASSVGGVLVGTFMLNTPARNGVSDPSAASGPQITKIGELR